MPDRSKEKRTPANKSNPNASCVGERRRGKRKSVQPEKKDAQTSMSMMERIWNYLPTTLSANSSWEEPPRRASESADSSSSVDDETGDDERTSSTQDNVNAFPNTQTEALGSNVNSLGEYFVNATESSANKNQASSSAVVNASTVKINKEIKDDDEYARMLQEYEETLRENTALKEQLQSTNSKVAENVTQEEINSAEFQESKHESLQRDVQFLREQLQHFQELAQQREIELNFERNKGFGAHSTPQISPNFSNEQKVNSNPNSVLHNSILKSDKCLGSQVRNVDKATRFAANADEYVYTGDTPLKKVSKAAHKKSIPTDSSVVDHTLSVNGYTRSDPNLPLGAAPDVSRLQIQQENIRRQIESQRRLIEYQKIELERQRQLNLQKRQHNLLSSENVPSETPRTSGTLLQASRNDLMQSSQRNQSVRSKVRQTPDDEVLTPDDRAVTSDDRVFPPDDGIFTPNAQTATPNADINNQTAITLLGGIHQALTKKSTAASRKIPEPGTFYGRNTEEWDYKRDMFINYKAATGMNDDEARIWLDTKVGDEAMRILRGARKNKRQTWDDVINLFDKRFGISHDTTIHMTNFENVRQRRYEKVASLIDRLSSLRQLAEPQEDEATHERNVIRRTIHALSDDRLRDKLVTAMKLDPTYKRVGWSLEYFTERLMDLEDGCSTLRMIESKKGVPDAKSLDLSYLNNIREWSETPQENSDNEHENDPEICNMCDREHEQAKCPEFQLAAISLGYGPPEHVTEAGQSTNWFRAILRTPGLCWTCGEPGHHQASCPKKQVSVDRLQQNQQNQRPRQFNNYNNNNNRFNNNNGNNYYNNNANGGYNNNRFNRNQTPDANQAPDRRFSKLNPQQQQVWRLFERFCAENNINPNGPEPQVPMTNPTITQDIQNALQTTSGEVKQIFGQEEDEPLN